MKTHQKLLPLKIPVIPIWLSSDEEDTTTNRYLLPGLSSSSQESWQASLTKREVAYNAEVITRTFIFLAKWILVLDPSRRDLFLYFYKGPLPYPSQSLQQEGLETIIPCNQIFLQLLIIQRGQQWHILHLPTMEMGKAIIKTLSLFSAADVTEMRRAKKGSLLQKKSFHVFTPLLLLLPYQNNRLFKLGFIFSPCMQLIYHHNLQTLNADN